MRPGLGNGYRWISFFSSFENQLLNPLQTYGHYNGVYLFISCLFKGVVNISDYEPIESNYWIILNKELESMLKEAVAANLVYYFPIYLEENHKKFS